MVVYGNILNNVDSVSFGGFLASYVLIPLCITVTILGAVESYSSNHTLKTISNCIIIATTVIGFLGAKLYFIIPSIFILFKFYSTYLIPNKKEDTIENKCTEVSNKSSNESNKIRKVVIDKEQMFSEEKTITYKQNSNPTIIQTRLTMAKELLSKNADIDFICELTGLTSDQIETIKQENN